MLLGLQRRTKLATRFVVVPTEVLKVVVSIIILNLMVTHGSRRRCTRKFLMEEDVVEVDPSFSTLSVKFGRTLVGRTRDFSVLRNINVSLKEAGFRDIEIQYLGGLTVLLSFVGEMEAKKFTEFGGVWTRWFVSINPWVGQALSFECLAWINIFGVPPPIFSPRRSLI
ncbi:hypothetical protein Hanom_Chr14g01262161 [Helianthus anomalus]